MNQFSLDDRSLAGTFTVARQAIRLDGLGESTEKGSWVRRRGALIAEERS